MEVQNYHIVSKMRLQVKKQRSGREHVFYLAQLDEIGFCIAANIYFTISVS